MTIEDIYLLKLTELEGLIGMTTEEQLCELHRNIIIEILKQEIN